MAFSTSHPSIPLSVLDLALVADGDDTTQALAQTTETAKRCEALGYHRFWVAEHHNMATVASTSPAVLIAHLGTQTETIRLGSGGVMLPNHSSLVIAEQFAMLEALHPGRIDLGLGRAPGTDLATARALRGANISSDEQFPTHLVELMGYLGDPRQTQGPWSTLSPAPDLPGTPMMFLLGSSDFSARLAAKLGLPFAFAHHFDMGGTVEAVDLYRTLFQPSPVLDKPLTLVTASVLTAADSETARHRAAPSRLRRWGLRSGRLLPLIRPSEAMSHPAYSEAEAMSSSDIIGEPDEAAKALQLLADRTSADEIMIFTSSYELSERLESYELLAAQWGIAPVPA